MSGVQGEVWTKNIDTNLWIYRVNICGTSLIVQLVKNLPAMRETWIQSVSWEDPLEKGKVTHSSILAWRIS